MSVFKPNASNNQSESDLDDLLQQDLQMCLPLNPTSPYKIVNEIRNLESGKAPGFELITAKILQELS